MKILVTGGAGFIGSHTCQSFLEKGHEVLCVDNLNQYYDVELKKRNLSTLNHYDSFEFIEEDIRNTETIPELVEKVDVINHQAAQPGVRISVENPQKSHSINTTGTLNLLESARKHEIEHFLFASSSSIYGENPDLPFSEESEKVPVSPYGTAKLAAENYVRLYGEIYGLPTVSLRYFTVYGPRMRPDLAISIFTKNALNGQKIEIFGDGKQTRDFTYISDVIEAQKLCLENKIDEGKAYNIGSGERIKINKLAEKIVEKTDSKSKIVHKEPRKGDAKHTWADTSKAKEELGWSPSHTLEEGLEKFIKWYREERN